MCFNVVISPVVAVWVSDPDGEQVGGGDPPPVLHHRGPAEETAARLTPQLPHTHHRGRGTHTYYETVLKRDPSDHRCM